MMHQNKYVGLGFRRDMADEILSRELMNPAFVEVAPENWIDMGGIWKKKFNNAAKKFAISTHGLSLSIGSPEEIDWDFLQKIKEFIAEYNVQIYSEHLSYTKAANAHLFDLMPIPFRMDAVEHVSNRIKRVQDFLGINIAIENVSYYTPVAAEMSEIDFINLIVEKSGCNLLLDVNNIYVNAFNHGYDSQEFLKNLPLNKVVYIHMAGHDKVREDLIIDTHGQPIIDPVFELFENTVELINPVPVLLERDFNMDDIQQLSEELQKLESICHKAWQGKEIGNNVLLNEAV